LTSVTAATTAAEVAAGGWRRARRAPAHHSARRLRLPHRPRGRLCARARRALGVVGGRDEQHWPSGPPL